MGKIKTEEEFKNALGVKDWDEIGDDKVPAIIKMLPDLNPELVDMIIKVIPVSTEALSKIVFSANQMYDGLLEVIRDKASIEAFKLIINKIDKASQKQDLPFDELKKYTDEMLKVARELANLEHDIEVAAKEMQTQKLFFILSIVAVAVIGAVLFALSLAVPGIILEIIVLTVCVAIIIALSIIYRNKRKAAKYNIKHNR